VFESSASRERKGFRDSSTNVSTGTANEDNQQAIASDCSESSCTVGDQKRTLQARATQSYRNVGCSNSYQDWVSANTLSMKKTVYRSKIVNIKTSNEFTSSTDDSSVSVGKVMMKYQEGKQILNFRNTENPSIHVSL
jgi:hypothetical protein